MKKYIAKPDTWFDKGTEVKHIAVFDQEDWGLFQGYRNGSLDEETCLLEEFEVVDTE